MQLKISNKKRQLSLGLFLPQPLPSAKVGLLNGADEMLFTTNEVIPDILYFALYITKQQQIHHFQLFNSEDLAKQVDLKIKDILRQQGLSVRLSKDLSLIASLNFNRFWQKSYFNQQKLKYDDLKQQVSTKIERELGLNSSLVNYDFNQQEQQDFYRVDVLVTQKQPLIQALASLNKLKIDHIDGFAATVFRSFSEKLHNLCHLDQSQGLEQKLFIYQDQQHYLALFYSGDLQVINLKIQPDLTQFQLTHQPQQLYLYGIKVDEFQQLSQFDCSKIELTELDYDDYFLADGCALAYADEANARFNYHSLNVLDWRSRILAQRVWKSFFIGLSSILFSVMILLFFMYKNQQLIQNNQQVSQQLIKLQQLNQQQNINITKLKQELQRVSRSTGIKAQNWLELLNLFSQLGKFGFLRELNFTLQTPLHQSKQAYVEVLVVGEANNQADFERVYSLLKNSPLIASVEISLLGESQLQNYISFELRLISQQFK